MGMRGTHPVRSQKKTVPAPDPQWPRDLLLTGAIGFLGAHLLTDLPGATGARVWCLVRAGDAAHARPATSPCPVLACLPAASASSPSAPTSSTTRAPR